MDILNKLNEFKITYKNNLLILKLFLFFFTFLFYVFFSLYFLFIKCYFKFFTIKHEIRGLNIKNNNKFIPIFPTYSFQLFLEINFINTIIFRN